MTESLRQTFEEQLTYLPAINQQALRDFDWSTELITIGKQFGLHIDQLEDLQIETMLVLVGVVSGENYLNELINRLAISPSEAEKIIDQVNERIFTPIHDYIIRGGPEKQIETPNDIMEHAGFSFTTSTIDPFTETKIQPISASDPTISETPISQPIIINQTTQTQSPIGSPLQFNPNTNPISPQIPETIIPESVTPILSAKEKLEKMYQERKKIIDMTIQSMDQQKPAE